MLASFVRQLLLVFTTPYRSEEEKGNRPEGEREGIQEKERIAYWRTREAQPLPLRTIKGLNKAAGKEEEKTEGGG